MKRYVSDCKGRRPPPRSRAGSTPVNEQNYLGTVGSLPSALARGIGAWALDALSSRASSSSTLRWQYPIRRKRGWALRSCWENFF